MSPLRRYAGGAFALLVLVYLYAPIVAHAVEVIVLYSVMRAILT